MKAIFSLGEIVSYSEFGRTLTCTVTRIMPEDGAKTRHYRVRDSAEGFERSVPEATLLGGARVRETAESRAEGVFRHSRTDAEG
jgi:hypothetical protein